jgi:16S rRNA (cytidine1402-2'-O)-methyltransferase
MKKGTLYIIPAPLNHKDLPDPQTIALLRELASKSTLLVEDFKQARRRWILWGLPREEIDRFQAYNEHNQLETIKDILADLKKGMNVFLISDEGLPAFCDPGQGLISACHSNKIKIRIKSFSQSISAAVALSGFPHNEFHFSGFPPRNTEERRVFWRKQWQRPEMFIVLDTPYRLKKCSQELRELAVSQNRWIFIGQDLTLETEKHYWGPARDIPLTQEKTEYILVIAPLSFNPY